METAAELVPRCTPPRPGVCGKKGAIIAAYLNPPLSTRVICIDDMGPIAVKTYPGEEWKVGRHRATFEPYYGRRGKVWLHGAFEPATGQASILISPSRDSASHIQLLEQVVRQFPADRWLLIEDNLSTHKSRQVKLALTKALAYWNAHAHPYRWKKPPQEQVTLLGGFGVSRTIVSSFI